MAPHRGFAPGGPANGHRRYGSRATRLQSKLKGVAIISLQRLERLLQREAAAKTRRQGGPA